VEDPLLGEEDEAIKDEDIKKILKKGQDYLKELKGEDLE
jgi:hypothetical protein